MLFVYKKTHQCFVFFKSNTVRNEDRISDISVNEKKCDRGIIHLFIKHKISISKLILRAYENETVHIKLRMEMRHVNFRFWKKLPIIFFFSVIDSFVCKHLDILTQARVKVAIKHHHNLQTQCIVKVNSTIDQCISCKHECGEHVTIPSHK